MGYFEFVMRTKLCSGENALEHIPYELSRLKAVKPLIITDKTLEKLGMLKVLTDALDNMPHALFTDVPPDSDLKKAENAAALYRAEKCDGVIALGGGSVIDTAKGAVALLTQNASEIKDIIGCEELPRGEVVPFIALPTTAGTGSEATSVAVIADTERQVKLEIISDQMLPTVAVLDPRLTLGLPPRATAATAIDALCHAIEAFSCRQKNPVSDAFAYAAVKAILSALPEVIKNPQNKAARLELANASFMAGVSFSNSMVGAVHAVGHALGAVCHVAHGEAMAILLPRVMRFNQCAEYRDLAGLFDDPEPVVALEVLLQSLHNKTGLPITLSQTGKVAESDFDAIAEKALNDGAILFNVKPLEKSDILQLLKDAF